VVLKLIWDLDEVAHDGEWTGSNIEDAPCGLGEALLGSGFAFTTSSNGEAIWTQALPIVNGETKGVGWRFLSDAGGTVHAEVAAICLNWWTSFDVTFFTSVATSVGLDADCGQTSGPRRSAVGVGRRAGRRGRPTRPRT
jgi:hypothetical protein